MPDLVYLASQSPRRRELLTQIGIGHRVIAIDVDESRLAGEAPDTYVQRLAREKAAAGWRAVEASAMASLPVLGADTAVVLDQTILGKPADAADARAMLERLSGRMHEVLTAVALVGADGEAIELSRTKVWFRTLTVVEIERYWATAEPRDKAGAYGIQGLAAVFIERIEGSYSGVVGLPLFETAALLQRYGIAAGAAA